MPVDKAVAESILGTFRNMVEDCKNKNYSGESFDKMCEAFSEMERLSLEMNDVMEFSTKLSNDGLYMKFSQHYGEVLMEAAKPKKDEIYSDEHLLQQTLRSYEKAIESLKGNKDEEKITYSIKKIIELGRSGISYPVFLRLIIEKGLDKAMEGNIIQRESIVKDLEWANKNMLPVYIDKHKKILDTYDELAIRSPFGIPDNFEFELCRQKIEWEYAPAINRWDAIVTRWQKMLELVNDWLDAFTSFAPGDSRYAGKDQSETQKNIRRHKGCNPGFLKERERIFIEYFRLKWEDIFIHETFLNEQKAGRVFFTKEKLELIKETYKHCRLRNEPPKDIIERSENLRKNIKDILNS